jgi:hypothetical protein
MYLKSLILRVEKEIQNNVPPQNEKKHRKNRNLLNPDRTRLQIKDNLKTN